MAMTADIELQASKAGAPGAVLLATMACFGYVLAAAQAQAQVKETVLHTFIGGADGANPQASLLIDSTGPNGTVRGLFGATSSGGVDPGCGLTTGCGTVFKLKPPKDGHRAWPESILSIFPSSGNLGANPSFAGLTARTKAISAKSPLYGTTSYGGIDGGNGTIFSLTGTTATTLYSFTGGADGANPADPAVVIDKMGALYVSTQFGGAQVGCGTVVKLTPPVEGKTKWSETVLWTFSGGSDGCIPVGLLLDKAGRLFGAAQYGGDAANNGTILELTPPAQGQTAWTEQTLWQFQGGPDGTQPNPITAGKHGEIYGTTYSGGTGCNRTGCGTVFELLPPAQGSTAWTKQIVWNFVQRDGANPTAALLEDSTGALYGTASEGGLYDQGTVIKLTPPASGQTAWTETTLLRFRAGTGSGGQPMAALSADATGVLYGTTVTGADDNGVVFSLTGTGFTP